MATAALTPVLNKLTEMAGDEWRLIMKVVKDVKFLGDKFEWLQALLTDADQQRRVSTNAFVALWVKQARDTAFDVEDVLDEFSWKVEKAKLSCYDWKAVLQFQWATTSFTQLWVTHRLSSKIGNINDRIKELDTNKTTYKIELNPSSSSWTPSFSNTITTWSSQDSDPLVGLEGQVQKLIEELKEDEGKTKFISIIGQNGSGRSMLAKKAYDSTEIQKYFEVVAWKSLPPKFRLDETLSHIHKKVSEQGDGEEGDCTLHDMGKALCFCLKKKRYLIVLSGIDSLEDWKKIRPSLPDNQNGSRVVLIPRNGSEVARLSKTEEFTAFEQDFSFSQEESSALFDQKFWDRSSYTIGYGPYIRQIHEVTKGHPMSIVLLANVLRSKELSDWEKVFKYLKVSKEAYPIDRILSLSFDDLPHQLKSCFLYFAAVPQSKGIETNQLVRIWIAEGFIQPKSGKTLEEVGESYLKELISRSLVRIEEKDEFGEAAVVAVDDHVHSFLQSEAHETSFVEIQDNANLVSPAKIRRLSIQNYSHKYVQIKNSLPKLRSLLCDCLEEQTVYSKLHGLRFLLKSKYLQVIDLHGLIIKELPSGITSMIHLRYLGVRCKEFKKLPYSIGKLRNLQTLDIRKSSVVEIPNSFWEISTLRHLLSDSVKLPKKIGELINLQTLQIADCTNWKPKKAGGSFARRENNEGLDLDTKKDGFLDNISNIRILKLTKLSTAQIEEISESLNNLAFLRHLSLKVNDDVSIPSRIFTSLRCLQSMELHGQLHSLGELDGTSILYNLPNLMSLTITNSMVKQEFINLLCKLPSLTRLSLCKSYSDKNIEFCPKGFENLQVLDLNGSNELEEFKEIPEGALPKLKKLILSGCTKLKSLPEGLQNVRLEEVVLHNIPGITEGIKGAEGRNYEKVRNVNTIKPRPMPQSANGMHACMM